MSNSREKTIEEATQHAINRLIEHVDSVRIFVVFRDEEKKRSATLSLGGGCYFAQRASITAWLRREEIFDDCAAQQEFEENT